MTDTTDGFPFKDAALGLRSAATKVIAGFHFRKQILYNESGVAAEVGAGAKAAGLRIAAPTDPDLRTGALNITARDVVSSSASGQNSVSIVTGIPTAGSVQSQALNGHASGLVQVTGTWTGTLAFELSADGGTTWVSTPMRNKGTVFTVGTVTANGIFYGDVSGASHFRVRSTAAMTGTATVNMNFSSESGAVQVLNPLRIGDNTTGATATVKAASGTPDATDTQVIVGTHPNSPEIALLTALAAPGGYSAAVTLTRTADTNSYIANDVLGAATGSTAALTFAAMGASGKEVMITSVSLEIDQTSVISGQTSYVLHLYNVTPPSVYGDNVAWDLASGDRASYLGAIQLGAPVDLGSTLFVEAHGINKQVKLASASLFGYLVTNGAYQPQSGTVHVITLHSSDV